MPVKPSVAQRLQAMHQECLEQNIIPEQIRFRDVPLAELSREELMIIIAYEAKKTLLSYPGWIVPSS